jgi:hypothetical protein
LLLWKSVEAVSLHPSDRTVLPVTPRRERQLTGAHFPRSNGLKLAAWRLMPNADGREGLL